MPRGDTHSAQREDRSDSGGDVSQIMIAKVIQAGTSGLRSLERYFAIFYLKGKLRGLQWLIKGNVRLRLQDY